MTTYHQVGSHTLLDGIRNTLQNGCVGDGTTNDRAALNTLANTTLQSAGGIIFFPSGYTFRVSSALTFPVNVTLWFGQGAKLTVDTGITVTIQGAVDAVPGSIIFTGLGTVSCTAVFPAVTSISWWDSVAGTLGFTSNYYGTYTPVASALTNLAAPSFVGLSMWIRNGNVVTVRTRVTLDPTLFAPTASAYTQTLPVASDLSLTADMMGAVNFYTTPGQNGIVVADTTNNKAIIQFMAAAAAAQAAMVEFSYIVK